MGSLLLVACGAEPDAETESVDGVADAIRKGVPVPGGVDWWGAPYAGCSSTLMRPQWALTARHCGLTVGTAVTTNGITAFADHVIDHPTRDVTLMHLDAPLSGTLGPFPLFKGPVSALLGQELYCSGWGANNTTCHWVEGIGWTDCTGYGTQRAARLAVSQAPDPNYPTNYTLIRSLSGQITASGDSGSGCLLDNANNSKLKQTGVNSWGDSQTFGNQESAHAIRDWVGGIIGTAPALGALVGYERSDIFDAVVYKEGNQLRELSNELGSWRVGTLPTTNLASNPAVFIYPDG